MCPNKYVGKCPCLANTQYTIIGLKLYFKNEFH